MRIYLDLAAASLKGQMSYRRSFLLEVVTFSIFIGIEVVPLFYLFEHFPTVAGWDVWEVILLYSIATIGYSIGDVLASGLYRMSDLVRQGDFDRMLVRPLSPLLQLLAHEVTMFRFGKTLPGFVGLAVASTRVGVDWGPREAVLVADAVIASIPIYLALHLANATLCFWTVQSTEVMNAFTHGGHEMSKYPVPIYPEWMRRLFVYAIPIGLATYVPTARLLEKPDPLGLPSWLVWLCPVVGWAFLALAAWGWRIGIAHYQSTGS